MYLDGRLDAAVESDVVGYTTTTITGKGEGVVDWYQIGIQFKGLGEGEDKIKLIDAIQVNGLTPGTLNDVNSAPSILVYNKDGSYTTYCYVTDAYTADYEEQVTGWAKDDGYYLLAENAYLNVGDAVWFKVRNLAEDKTATLTVAGVASVIEAQKEIKIDDNGWKLIANPYPQAIKISEIKCSLTPGSLNDVNTAPSILVYNKDGSYTTYCYVTDAYTADYEEQVTGWSKDDGYYLLTSDEIPVGVGFWIKSPNKESGTLTFEF